jgi:para-aminobenzoate synthetase/4-amino-4-deoxychorismate lyase
VDPQWPIGEFGPAPAADPARGVFETILVIDGRPVEWARHRARLAASVHELYGAALEERLDRRVAALASGRRRARLRVVARPAAAGALAVDAEITALGPERRGRPPQLAPLRVRAGFGRHKLVDRGWLELLEAAVPPGLHPLLVSGSGDVLETTRANVFAVHGDAVATPPLDGSILPGITRAVLLDEARRLGIDARERALALDELQAADALMLTGSLRLVERSVRRPGGRAEAVVAALADAVAGAARAARHEVATRGRSR